MKKRNMITMSMQDTIISLKHYKTEVICFGFFMCLTLSLLSCNDEELSADTIIENTVKAYGGEDKWSSIKQLSFDKKVTLFLKDGTVERGSDQFQLFQFNHGFGKIEWEENEIEHQILFENNKINKKENDSSLTSQNELYRAERAFFASEFVIKQPFDLLREDVILTREADTLINNKACYMLSVAYKDEAPDADRWHYVIDKESFSIVANKVVLKDHTSWVENLTFDTETDFKFNAHRKSYRLNEKGEKTYLRAEYFYSNYSVIFQD